MKFTRSFTLKAESGQVFDELRQILPAYGYKEEGVSWPNYVVVKRGSGGLLKTDIKDCKTLLTISIKQHGDDAFILYEYDLKALGGLITSGDKAILENEVEKMKGALHGSPTASPSEVSVSTQTVQRTCELCGSSVSMSATFCSNCGRSVKPLPVSIKLQGREIMKRGIELNFEPYRAKTGYDSLDVLLYGGLPEGYSIILTSHSCEERDLLVTKILETGVKSKEVTFYVSNEITRVRHLVDEHPEIFYSFICNPQANLIAPDTPNVYKIGGCDRLTDLSLALSSASKDLPEEGGRRIVLNNISDVLLSCHAQTTRKWLMELLTKLKAQNFTVLAVMNPFMHASEETQAILDLFDGHIEMFEKDGRISRTHLKVKRMYNQKYHINEIPITKESFQTNIVGGA